MKSEVTKVMKLVSKDEEHNAVQESSKICFKPWKVGKYASCLIGVGTKGNQASP